MSWHHIPKGDAWKQTHTAMLARLRNRAWLHCDGCRHSTMIESARASTAASAHVLTPLLTISKATCCRRCGARREMLLAEAARYADGNWKRKCHECLRPGLGREPVLEGLEGLQDVPQTPPAVGQIAAVGKPAASLDGRSKRTPSTRNCGAPDQIGVCYSSVGSRHSVVTPTRP
jgi:hypothetical protein